MSPASLRCLLALASLRSCSNDRPALIHPLLLGNPIQLSVLMSEPLLGQLVILLPRELLEANSASLIVCQELLPLPLHRLPDRRIGRASPLILLIEVHRAPAFSFWRFGFFLIAHDEPWSFSWLSCRVKPRKR